MGREFLLRKSSVRMIAVFDSMKPKLEQAIVLRNALHEWQEALFASFQCRSFHVACHENGLDKSNNFRTKEFVFEIFPNSKA